MQLRPPPATLQRKNRTIVTSRGSKEPDDRHTPESKYMDGHVHIFTNIPQHLPVAYTC
jgi:hypothetical protein